MEMHAVTDCGHKAVISAVFSLSETTTLQIISVLLVLILVAVGIIIFLALTLRNETQKGSSHSGKMREGAVQQAQPVSLISPPAEPQIQPTVVVEKGLNYLIEGEDSDKAIKAFDKLMAEGAKGLVITHIHPKKLRRRHPLPGAELVWLSEMSEEKPSIEPSRMAYELSEKILDFLKENRDNGVVMLDGVDLLIQKHDFPSVLDFIQNVNEVASVNEATIILPVNSKAMKELEFNQLKRKFDRS
jgi:hypothetical protein